MAKVLVIGSMAQVEILTDPEDEELVLAKCDDHSVFDGRLAPPGDCSWEDRFDSTDDAIAGAEQHADGVR